MQFEIARKSMNEIWAACQECGGEASAAEEGRMRRRRILPLIYSTPHKLSNRDPSDESDRLARVSLSNIPPPSLPSGDRVFPRARCESFKIFILTLRGRPRTHTSFTPSTNE